MLNEYLGEGKIFVLEGVYLFGFAQVRSLSSTLASFLSFRAVTVAFCVLWIRLDDLDIGFGFSIASQFKIDLMIDGSSAICFNIFALAMIFFLDVG
ncbi:hypothetical protein [Undibacterium curvum]|uniref:Uncharacterized protein n=1 Tax=Undibacterium curvum TaxID=2762294 RepID=A0ABR7A5T7_9BURK|nr:hypothetical protein [Undibacterium curvum]MBC3932243.1 hypothetical protein [Undibacterium curvum]